MGPFDYLNSILNGEKIIFDDVDKKEYNAFLTNRGLSMNIDTVDAANRMNQWYDLDSDMKYDYLYHSVRKKKRLFYKWPKSAKYEFLAAVMEYFNVSHNKALEIISVLTKTKLKEIREIMNSRQQ